MPRRDTSQRQSGTIEAGHLALDLLGLRTSEETEKRVLQAFREVSGARWVALYKPTGKWYQAVIDGHDTDALPNRLENVAIHQAFRNGLDLRELSADDLPGFAEGSLVGGIRSEFDGEPVLVLIGPPPVGEYTLPEVQTIRETLSVCGAGLRNLELIERLRSQVFFDFLTGCYNRRAFEEHLMIELVRARRYERPLSLMLVDLDDFKHVNDGSGHDAGDHVLQRVGETLRSAFRTTDRVCRFGGDEFAVIFPETSREEALRLAERIRRQIGSAFPDASGMVTVTASIGVASYPADATRAEDLLKATDRALYQAKRAGRNCVVSA